MQPPKTVSWTTEICSAHSLLSMTTQWVPRMQFLSRSCHVLWLLQEAVWAGWYQQAPGSPTDQWGTGIRGCISSKACKNSSDQVCPLFVDACKVSPSCFSSRFPLKHSMKAPNHCSCPPIKHGMLSQLLPMNPICSRARMNRARWAGQHCGS